MQPMKLKVNELTRAEREGRTQRGKAVPADVALENGEEAEKVEGSEEEEEASSEDGIASVNMSTQNSLLDS